MSWKALSEHVQGEREIPPLSEIIIANGERHAGMIKKAGSLQAGETVTSAQHHSETTDPCFHRGGGVGAGNLQGIGT